MSKPKRQPKRQPTQADVEQTMRRNAEELYKYYDRIFGYFDIKQNMDGTALYAEAVAAHEAFGAVISQAVPATLDELETVPTINHRTDGPLLEPMTRLSHHYRKEPCDMSSISCTTPREKLTAMFAQLNVPNPAESAGHAISVMPTIVQGIDLFEQMYVALGKTFPQPIHDALCKAGIQYDDALYQADPSALNLARTLVQDAYDRAEAALVTVAGK